MAKKLPPEDPITRLNRVHTPDVNPCPECDLDDYPVLCVCGGDIHAEVNYQGNAGQLIRECTKCKHKYRDWPIEPIQPDEDNPAT